MHAASRWWRRARTPGRKCLTVSPTFTGNDGSEVHCRRDECVVALASADGAVYLSLPVEFRFGGEVTADPSAGLVDGQLVQLTGHDVSPTYVGPPFWFFPTTGNWVLGQCEAAIADALSLYNVFDRRTNVPGRTDVDIPASGDDLDLGTAAVQASITSFLGRPTDCTATAGACVLALLRLERTGR